LHFCNHFAGNCKIYIQSSTFSHVPEANVGNRPDRHLNTKIPHKKALSLIFSGSAVIMMISSFSKIKKTGHEH
jgi:hypothetical protein